MFYVVRELKTYSREGPTKTLKHMSFWTGRCDLEFAFGCRYVAKGFETEEEACNDGLQVVESFFYQWRIPGIREFHFAVVEELSPEVYRYL